jgi:DnaJ-class molecular chaperone
VDYWQECISEAFEDAGVMATEEQIQNVVGWVEGAHENYGMAMGHHCIPNPLKEENEKLRKIVVQEREKVLCNECGGKGVIRTDGPAHYSISSCWKCHGEGRHSP